MRRVLVALLLTSVLLLSACTRQSDQGGNQPGYVGVNGQITRVDPAKRKPAPVVSGPALGSTASLSTAG